MSVSTRHRLTGFSRHAFLLAAVLAATPLCAPRADDAMPFKGTRITISVGYGAGGGFDLYARVLARFIGKHIPGEPTVIVQNVTGAGSLKLANSLYNVSPKDGTAIGMVAQSLPVSQVLGSPGIKFDFAKFQAIGRMASMDTAVIVWHTVPVKTIADAQQKTMNVAATGPSSDAFITPAVLNNIIGTKFNIISGYTGTRATMTALERREADATTVSISSLLAEFSSYIKSKDAHAIVQNALKRHPAFPDAPTMVELARNDDDRRILTLFAAGSAIGRFFIVPPGVAADRVAILRKAFMETMSDPALIAAAEKSHLELEPMSGQELQAVIAGLGGMPPALLERALAAQKWSK